MSAPALPAARPPSSSVEHPSAVPRDRSKLWLSALVAAVWVLFLATITWRTANPPVVNVVQISESDLIFVGRWEDRAAGRFHIERELKHGQFQGAVNVLGLPDRGLPRGETWVIPVTKVGDAYSVTQGVFTTGPLPLDPQGNAAVWKVHVPPQCYPATDDVLNQVQRALAAQ